MQCYCGGQLTRHAGVNKQTGKPYKPFYGCNRFNKGCRVKLTMEQFLELENQGVTQLTAEQYTPAKRLWTFPNFTRYRPHQRSNPNPASDLRRRRMTDEQEDVIGRFTSPGVHRIRVNADAGSGKSSLARQIALQTQPVRGYAVTGIVLAYNKRPSVEMQETLPAHWTASTVHSAGNDACAAYYGINKNNPNDYKTKDILIAEYGASNDASRDILYSIVIEFVEMCKALVLTEYNSEEEILMYADMYNVNKGEAPTQAAEMCRNVLQIGSTVEGVRDYGHDFGDMIYLPVRHKLPVAQYPYVIGDEWQDSSPARMMLALMMVDPYKGSLLVVGDTMQCIYFFTYADSDAMDRAKEMTGPSTEDFPLTVNWRCPEKILSLARIHCPTIRARPNAPEGHIHEIDNDQFYRIVNPGDVVLCRVNADLIGAAYKLIKQGIGAVILGRDIAANLKNIIVRLGTDTTTGGYCTTIELLRRLNKWYVAEQDLIAAKDLRNPERAYQKLEDEYLCILALCGVELDDTGTKLATVGIPNVEGVLAKIDRMFGEQTDRGYDPKRVVTCSTIHKFKGGQAAKIFDLRANENHPHPMAESEQEQKGEICVAHVMVTRCGDGTDNPDQRLFFVGGMPAMYRDNGGAQFITPYDGPMR